MKIRRLCILILQFSKNLRYKDVHNDCFQDSQFKWHVCRTIKGHLNFVYDPSVVVDVAYVGIVYMWVC